jgi:hypothetical protein
MQGEAGIEEHIMDGGKSVVIYYTCKPCEKRSMQEYIDSFVKSPLGGSLDW